MWWMRMPGAWPRPLACPNPAASSSATPKTLSLRAWRWTTSFLPATLPGQGPRYLPSAPADRRLRRPCIFCRPVPAPTPPPRRSSPTPPAPAPAGVLVPARCARRLHDIERLHRSWATGIRCEYMLAQTAADNDAVLQGLRPAALVV